MLRDHMAKLATGIKISATVALRSRSASLFSLSRMPEADVRQRLPGGRNLSRQRRTETARAVVAN